VQETPTSWRNGLISAPRKRQFSVPQYQLQNFGKERFPTSMQFLKELFLSITCVDIDSAIGKKAGDILHSFRKSHAIEFADALIAASALLNEAVLWTKNRKHYPMKAMRFFA
jgi:hypothetical protein